MPAIELLLAVIPMLSQAGTPGGASIVKRGALTPVLEMEGRHEPLERAEFKTVFEAFSGECAILSALPHGAPVKKGDLLLDVDRKPILEQIAALENEIKGARAARDHAESLKPLADQGEALALRHAEDQVRDAEQALKVFLEVEGRHLLENADLMVRYAEEHVADTKEELEQLLKMYKTEELTNATAEIVVRRTRRQLERSETQLRMQREEAELVKKVRYPQSLAQLKHVLASARIALETLRRQQGLTKTQREVEETRTREALLRQEEQLGKLRRDLERFPWKAPFDGIAYHGAFEHGQWAQAAGLAPQLRPGEKLHAGQVLFSVCAPSTQVLIEVPEEDVFFVRTGLSVRVTPLADPAARLEGLVAWTSAAPSPGGAGSVFPARVALAEAPARFLPGMKARVVITGQAIPDAILVPVGALRKEDGKTRVQVRKDGKASLRDVVVGRGDGVHLPVLRGLSEGEEVEVAE